jgi:hypothetical protein
MPMRRDDRRAMLDESRMTSLKDLGITPDLPRLFESNERRPARLDTTTARKLQESAADVLDALRAGDAAAARRFAEVTMELAAGIAQGDADDETPAPKPALVKERRAASSFLVRR